MGATGGTSTMESHEPLLAPISATQSESHGGEVAGVVVGGKTGFRHYREFPHAKCWCIFGVFKFLYVRTGWVGHFSLLLEKSSKGVFKDVLDHIFSLRTVKHQFSSMPPF